MHPRAGHVSLVIVLAALFLCSPSPTPFGRDPPTPAHLALGTLTMQGWVTPGSFSSPGVAEVRPTALLSVTINRSSRTLGEGDSVLLTAVPMCSGTSGCPEGNPIDYTWQLNNSLAELSNTSGKTITFRAAGRPGLINVTVSASLQQTSETNSTVTNYTVIQIERESGGSNPATPTQDLLEVAGFGLAVVVGIVFVIEAVSILRKRRRSRKVFQAKVEGDGD